MTLVELTMLPPCPQIMLTHEQDGKFFWFTSRMGTNKLFCGATLWGGNGGINQSKEVESCVDIIT